MKFAYQSLGFVFITLVSFYSSMAQNKKTELFIRYYQDVAFKDQNVIASPLVKWEDRDTIKYRIFGKLSFMSENEWNDFVSDLSNLTNILIQETKGSDYDIVVYFGTLKEYAKFTGANIPAQAMQNYSSQYTCTGHAKLQ